MIVKPVAVLDACVLYPAPLRDFLMWLALQKIYSAKWTTIIHDEWQRNLLLNRPDLSKERLDATVSKMDIAIKDANVTGFEKLIDGLTLPDQDDRHVLAAAIQGNANYIVTFNLKDFPSKYLSTYNVEAIHPDCFVEILMIQNSTKVLLAAKTQRAHLKRSPKTVDEFIDMLKHLKLTKTAAKLAGFKAYL